MCISNPQYVYLLQEREFVNSKEQIYKIGKTMQLNSKRFAQYPKGSILLLQVVCLDCNICETQIIQLFTHKYTRRRDIGSEYFEGDYNGMIADIFGIVMYEHRVIREHVAAEIPVSDNYIEEPVLDDSILCNEVKFINCYNKVYNCERCKYKTFVKQNYSKHFITERHKVKINTTDTLFEHKCIKCNTILLSRTSLWRHNKNCKVIPQTYSIN